jgi:NAD(P)-dependent dehydrogenase (short-subunit alcohol dehydrogenase family)
LKSLLVTEKRLNYDRKEEGCSYYRSSKGIGKAVTLSFAKSNGYSGIITNSRKIEEAQSASKEIKTLANCDSIAIEADVSKESDCIRLIEETVKHYGRIDILVNNVGI